jgi:tripartite-type tricarboxylate transporter receptor subunit TctC
VGGRQSCYRKASLQGQSSSAPASAISRRIDGILRDEMKLLARRQFLRLTAGGAALPVDLRIAWAQTYPSRPVRWIVGFPPAGGNDIVARLMGQWLSERLGQPFVIENRPGAATNIATQAVATAPPDGYTLLLAGLPNASNAALFGNLNFNFIRDITPIAGMIRIPNVMVVNPSVPAKTVAEFIAYAKAHPGKVNMASAGTGSAGHLAGELFKMLAGVDLVHVPYGGNGPALTALLGGQVDVLFASLPSSIEYVRTDRLRGLAVTGAMRSEALPDVPTIGEIVTGYEMSAWFGAAAPKGTPAEVIDKINQEINAGVADPKMKARFTDLGGIAITGSPRDFGKLIVEETKKWGKVIHAANIKPQ